MTGWKPVARWLIGLALFFWAGCAGGRPSCSLFSPETAKAAFHAGKVPDGPVHYRLSVDVRRRRFFFKGSGDLFFVPPDTLRMDFVSPFGEMLFSLFGAGGFLTAEAGGGAVPEEMAALFAGLTGADVTALLTDSDCLYWSNPGGGRVDLVVVERQPAPGRSGATLLK